MKNKINDKRKATKASNLILVRKIVEEHHTWRLSKIKQHLKEDYGVKLTVDTISRYKAELKEIDRLHKKEQRDAERAKHQEEKMAKTQSTTLAKKRQFPLIVKDPAGKPHTIPHDHYTAKVFWKHEDGWGDNLCYGPVNRNRDFWYWESSDIEYGSGTKSKAHSWRVPKSLRQRWADGDSL